MTDDLKNSVTAGDVVNIPQGGAGPMGLGLSVFVGPLGILGEVLQSVPYLDTGFGLPPPGSRYRDMVLALTPYIEGMWANAIYKATSKQAALGFRLEDLDDSQQRINRSQDILLRYDGRYVTGIQRGIADFLTINNGQHVEIVRQSNARGAKVLGLRHLDGLRCYPTGDPEWPVIYNSFDGRWHLMPAYSVIRLVDRPSPRVEMRGAGQCAADRAWESIIKLAAIETYFREKITGRKNMAIYIVNGITDQQLSTALRASDVEMSAESDPRGPAARGFVLYRGSRILTTMKTEPPALITIPIAEVAEGYNVADERSDSYRRYAHAVGINIDEFVDRPAGMNSGLSAAISDEAAEGQGLASWRKAWEHAMTYDVLPSRTTFYLATNDWRDQKQQAEVRQLRATTRAAMIQSGEITAAQALNLAVDQGDLPSEYMTEMDGTDAGAITDNQKLNDTGRLAILKAALQTSALATEQADDLITKNLPAALDWAKAVIARTDGPGRG